MLIDDFIPEYDFHERHETVVPAPKDAVRRSVDEWRPGHSLPWRLLLRLRGLGSPQGTLREWAEANGFVRLGETEYEVVYGGVGRFWGLDERRMLALPNPVEALSQFRDPRYAVAVMNLRLDSIDPHRTRVHTETRVRALSSGARRRFRLYWLLIRPFSGLLRRAMLNGIKARAIALGARAQQQPERRG